MRKISNLKLASLLVFSALASAFVLHPGSAHAATIAVSAGTDETTTNSYCSLSEAIVNVNNGDATTYPECTNTGDAFGTNDTINIGAGTILLVGNPTGINASVTFNGAGTGESTINGAGISTIFNTVGPADISISNMKLTGFNLAAAFITSNGTHTFSHLDVDGTNSSSNSPAFAGIGVIGDSTVVIDNVYVHNIHATAQDLGANGIILGTAGGGTINATVHNSTIANISSDTGGANGLTFITGLVSDLSPGTLHTAISNVTISNIHTQDSGPAAGISSFAAVNGGNTLIDFNFKNSTITDVDGDDATQSGGISIGGLSMQDTDVATTNATVSNVLLSNNLRNNIASNCHIFDGNAILNDGAIGNMVNTITSEGGNISNDTSCSSYFTQSTDKNNITNLADFLGPLSSNGGYVPTIPLLIGSPAIDSGVTISGLTDDARGVSRPQGAYDSGAYEYVSSTSVATLASTGENIKLFLIAAVGLVIASGAVLVVKARKR